jgi:hypothetical protein
VVSLCLQLCFEGDQTVGVGVLGVRGFLQTVRWWGREKGEGEEREEGEGREQVTVGKKVKVKEG